MNDTKGEVSEGMDARLTLLEDSLEALSDAVAIIDIDGTFVFGNTRYLEMFFEPGQEPRPGESAIQVVRKIVDGGRVFGIDQMDPDHAVLLMIIDCYSFVQNAEFALKDGSVIQVSSTPTRRGGALMTFRHTGRDRIGERRAAELLSEGFSSAKIGMVLWDAALAVQLFNSAWSDLTLPSKIGESIQDLFGRFVAEGMLSIPAGVDGNTYVQGLISRMHRGPTHQMLDLADGRRVQLSTFGISSGGVMATAVDVSVERDAEVRARTLLSDAVEALAIGVMHFDADLNLLMMNDAASRMVFDKTGRPDVGTSLGQILDLLIDAEDIPIPEGVSRMEFVQSFDSAAKAFRSDQRVAWSDGRMLEFSTNPTEMGGFLVSVQDLTDAVNADRAAQEANELVRTIVDASPTTFLVSKVETGEVIYATDASRERFGNISSTLSFFLKPEDRETYLKALLPTGSLTDYPVKFRRQDGSIMDGLTSARVIDYQGEKMIVSSTRDITDFLAMQAELETQRRHALQNEKLSALGELLAGVAHELSNPLSVVVGYAMMLRDELTDGPYAKKLDRIAIAADRCVRIVKMFLALAREKPATLEPCNIQDLIDAAVTVSCGGLQASGATLEQSVPSDLPPVRVDPDHVTQVFSNLIINAGHAVSDLGSDGRLSIRAYLTPGDNCVVIDLHDNGPGVPSEFQTRIFEPFFTTKDVGSGTGVGLAFSHRVISAHSGTLTVENTDDGGALFRVRLPVDKIRSAEIDHDDTIGAMSGQAPRVLVLDDDETVSEVIRDILTNAGYLVDICNEGSEALKRCTATNYDVILCDMRMPEMNGQQFHSALEDIHPKLTDRLIFLTGDTMNPATSTFIDRVGSPILEKPIMPTELLTQIAQHSSRE